MLNPSISSKLVELLKATGYSLEDKDEASFDWMDTVDGLHSFALFLNTLSTDNCLTEDEVRLYDHLKKTHSLVPDAELDDALKEYMGDEEIPSEDDIAILEETLDNYNEQLRRLTALETSLSEAASERDVNYNENKKSVVKQCLDSNLYECKELCESYQNAHSKVAEKWDWFYEEVRFGNSKVLQNSYLFQDNFNEYISVNQKFDDKLKKMIREWTKHDVNSTFKDHLPMSQSATIASLDSTASMSAEVVPVTRQNMERVFERLKVVEMELAKTYSETSGCLKAIAYFSNLKKDRLIETLCDLRVEIERLCLSKNSHRSDQVWDEKCEEFVKNYFLQYEVDDIEESLGNATETLEMYSNLLNVIQQKDHYTVSLILLLWEERKVLLAAQGFFKEFVDYCQHVNTSMKKRMKRLTRMQNKHQFMLESKSLGKIAKLSDDPIKKLMDGSTNLNSAFVEKLQSFMASCNTQQMELFAKISGIQRENINRLNEVGGYIKWLTKGPCLFPLLLEPSQVAFFEEISHQIMKWELKIKDLHQVYESKKEERNEPYKRKLDYLWMTSLVSRHTLINDLLKLEHDVEIYTRENDLMLKEKNYEIEPGK